MTMDVKAVVAEMEQATHLEDSFYLVDALKKQNLIKKS